MATRAFGFCASSASSAGTGPAALAAAGSFAARALAISSTRMLRLYPPAFVLGVLLNACNPPSVVDGGAAIDDAGAAIVDAGVVVVDAGGPPPGPCSSGVFWTRGDEASGEMH